MSKHLRLSVAVGLALLAAVVGYWLTVRYVGESPQKASEEAAAAGAPGAAVISETTVRHSPGGRTAWQVKLDQIQMQSGGGSVAAQGVSEALIYDKTGKPMVRLTADRVTGNTSSRDLEVSGNVRAVSPEGAVFDTGTVKWVQKDQKLVCPTQVTMRNQDTVVRANSCDFYVAQDLVKSAAKVQMSVGNNTLIGKGLTYNVKSEDFRMQQVQAIFNPETVGETLGR